MNTSVDYPTAIKNIAVEIAKIKQKCDSRTGLSQSSILMGTFKINGSLATLKTHTIPKERVAEVITALNNYHEEFDSLINMKKCYDIEGKFKVTQRNIAQTLQVLQNRSN